MNKKYYSTIILIVSLLLSSCDWGIFSDDYDLCREKSIGYQNYSLKIEGRWTESNFGNRTPEAYTSKAHFSRFVVFAHKSEKKIFTEGKKASSKLEELAETGSTDITSLYDGDNDIGCVIVGDGLADGGDSTKITIPVNNTYNTITVLSMIAPSPDWFVARTIQLAKDDNPLEGLPLFTFNNSFRRSGFENMKNYDAGTEQDTNGFSLDNDAESPQQDISLLQSPLSESDVLVKIHYERITP